LSQADSSDASNHLGAQSTVEGSLPSLSNARREDNVSDDDSALISLGQQFGETVAELQMLLGQPEKGGHSEELEAALARLEPIERAIMATTAKTVAGLEVKARHAAYVMSEQWNAPIDRLDWDARAARLLIENVCNIARASAEKLSRGGK